jgi:hypothetical protein
MADFSDNDHSMPTTSARTKPAPVRMKTGKDMFRACATGSTVTKAFEGWLTKKGPGMLKRDRRRWFVLYEDGELHYFSSPDLSERKGLLLVNGLQPAAFQVPLSSGHRPPGTQSTRAGAHGAPAARPLRIHTTSRLPPRLTRAPRPCGCLRHRCSDFSILTSTGSTSPRLIASGSSGVRPSRSAGHGRRIWMQWQRRLAP